MSFCDWTWYGFLNQDLICMKATYLTKEHLAPTTRCKVHSSICAGIKMAPNPLQL